ncbi:DNA primase [Prescottella equi]
MLGQGGGCGESPPRYTHLVPAARGEAKGRCPLPGHDERTPSFYVNPATGVFHCFGCGSGGDVIALLEQVEQLTFREAVEQLAHELGITIPASAPRTHGGVQGTPKLLRSALEVAARTYMTALRDDPASSAAREYLTARGFSADHARAWGIGWAPRAASSALLPSLAAAGLPASAGVDAGLVREGRSGRPYDTFAGRLIWPLHDPQGRIVGLAGRSLEDPTANPDRYRKYVNSDDSALFRKSDNLFGLAVARPAIVKARRVIVVEGYTDVMAVAASGHPEVVGVCGTAFTAAHARLLSRLLGPDGEIVVMLDADDAGQTAAWKIAVACHEFATVTLATPGEPGSDPCQLRADHGDQAVRDTINARQPLIEVVLGRLLAQADRPERAAAAARAIGALLSELSDPVLIAGYRQWAGECLGLPEGLPSPAAAPAPPARASNVDVEVKAGEMACVRGLALALVQDPQLWGRLPIPAGIDVSDVLPDAYARLVTAAASIPVGTPAALLSAVPAEERPTLTGLLTDQPEPRDPMTLLADCARAIGAARLHDLRRAMTTSATADALRRYTDVAAGYAQLTRLAR